MVYAAVGRQKQRMSALLRVSTVAKLAILTSRLLIVAADVEMMLTPVSIMDQCNTLAG